MTQIVLIDDHPIAIQGVGTMLLSIGRFSIAGTAKNLAEACNLMEQIEMWPEILILDISLGKESGLDFIPMLKKICKKRSAVCGTNTPGVLTPGVLVCSMHEDYLNIQRAINTGAQGYITKSAEPEEFIAAIETILSGNDYFPKQFSAENPEGISGLTRRENEIVLLVKQNFNNDQIAELLGINLRTVENHLGNIYTKMGITSRKEIVNCSLFSVLY